MWMMKGFWYNLLTISYLTKTRILDRSSYWLRRDQKKKKVQRSSRSSATLLGQFYMLTSLTSVWNVTMNPSSSRLPAGSQNPAHPGFHQEHIFCSHMFIHLNSYFRRHWNTPSEYQHYSDKHHLADLFQATHHPKMQQLPLMSSQLS